MMNKLLKALVETPFLPQLQERMFKLIRSEAGFAKVERDDLGNIELTSKGKKTKKVALLAHLNEIGFIVEHVDENGFLRFRNSSAVDERSLLGQRMMIHTKDRDVRGVIGAKPPHLLEREEAKKPVKISGMFLDVGAYSRKEAEEMGIRIGDSITLEGQLRELPDNRFVCKAMDDRAGCAAVIEALRGLARRGISATGWLLAQESTFPRGLKPDFAVAVEATLAGPYPLERVRVERHELPAELGKGPVLTLQEGGLVVSQKVRELLGKAASKAKIKLQVEAVSRAAVERVNPMKQNLPSAILSLPVKYLRTPNEMISGTDLKQTTKVLQNFVEST
jgi:endoglucanase